MATQPIGDPFVTVLEYLSASYEPDLEYVDGRVEDRNVGEHDHGCLQALLGTIFTINAQAWRVHTVTAVRLQVAPTRFRVPDVMVLRATAPWEPIVKRPPLIAIEILSPEDRISRFREKLDDYLASETEHIWLFDPQRRTAADCSTGSIAWIRKGVLTVPGTPIRIDPTDLFAKLDHRP